MSIGSIIQPGDKYNHLTVLERVEDRKFPNGEKKPTFLCECDCPERNRVVVIGEYLRNGHTKSCGCLLKEVQSHVGDMTRTHGLSKTKEAVVYYHLTSRHPDELCERWAKDNPNGMVNFYNDMHISYKPGSRLAKKYPTENYGPKNCYWL